MRAPLGWLKEFLDLNLGAQEISDRLTMAGLEVEATAEMDGENVFEVNVTPNRPDCLSIIGIARELSAILDVPLRMPEFKVAEAEAPAFRIDIIDKDLCARYTGRCVKDVRIAESPEWIRKRLDQCGIRSVNNVVDITNYVLLELGHPLHAFDLNTLRGGVIKVAKAGRDSRIITLDGVERHLPEDALLIWDAERPVAIAGVMGGIETEVTEATTDIFLESAWFLPGSVRRTSKTLGLKSESSYRFERGADIEMLEVALDRAACLIMEIAGGGVGKKLDAYPQKFTPSSITISGSKVNKTLGTALTPEEMTGILGRLNLGIKANGDRITIMPPSYRLDLKIEADIVEEIARLYGYDKIPSEAPKAEITPPAMEPRAAAIVEAKDAMRAEGFHEAINMSFMNENHLDVLSIPEGDGRRRAVRLRNPLRKEDALLRTMLAPSLIENFLHNFFRGARDIRIFELSRVFEDTGGKGRPTETLHAGAILYGDASPSLWKETAGGFYVIKGLAQSLLERLRIAGYSFSPSDEPFLHPGKSADILIGGEKAGFAGVLSPVVIERLDLKARPEVMLFEIDMDKTLRSLPGHVVYSPIPKFPHVERDISIVLDAVITASSVIELIRAYPTEFIEEVSVFDSYTGAGISAGKKSLAFAIRYRAKDRTLTDDEVETLHGGLLNYLIRKTGGEVRGSWTPPD